MTPPEAQMLLSIAASFDNRKPDAEAATAWSYALDGLRFVDCRDAIVQHYSRSKDWLMPADIRTAVRKIRDKRIAEAGALTPPPDLTPWEEIEWRRDELQRVGDGLPPSPETRVLVSRGQVVLPELPSVPPATTAKSAPADDAKRAAARAETDALNARGAGQHGDHLPPVQVEAEAEESAA